MDCVCCGAEPGGTGGYIDETTDPRTCDEEGVDWLTDRLIINTFTW